MRSDSQPEAIFSRLAVVSATPSIRPIAAVRAPRTFARNNGSKLDSISDETSVRKLVSVTTQTLRGRIGARPLGAGLPSVTCGSLTHAGKTSGSPAPLANLIQQ